MKITKKEIRGRDGKIVVPKQGVCCKTEFGLGGFTNSCPDCGADYNWSGQRLAPREQWGEETGEHPADIARIK